MPKPNVLLILESNPVSHTAGYVRAFQNMANVTTLGPVIRQAQLDFWEHTELHEEQFKDPSQVRQKFIDWARAIDSCDQWVYDRHLNVKALIRRRALKPDFVIWLDAGLGFKLDISAVDVPCGVILGDTHTGGLKDKLEQARAFDHVFVQFRKQDIPTFEANCGSVHWLPPAAELNSYSLIAPEHGPHIAFAGQTEPDNFPLRCNLLRYMLDAELPVVVGSYVLAKYQRFLADALIGFNCSLAKDINLRFMETLASGSLLLTDVLRRESGIHELAIEGKHYVSYADRDELLSLASYYLAQPEKAQRIAAEGQRHFAANHTFNHRAVSVLAKMRS